jgi:hypothetical protein
LVYGDHGRCLFEGACGVGAVLYGTHAYRSSRIAGLGKNGLAYFTLGWHSGILWTLWTKKHVGSWCWAPPHPTPPQGEGVKTRLLVVQPFSVRGLLRRRHMKPCRSSQ